MRNATATVPCSTRAAERGLLSPTEYQARLGEVAEASSVDELRRIVTELPAFGTPSARPVRSGDR